MAHRILTDDVGRDWDVWEVHPAAIDGPLRDDTQHDPAPRPTRVLVSRVDDRLRNGWLAFQAKHEKRRLSPIPTGWENLSDPDLRVLLDTAATAGKPSRLIE
jgi:hypothetical protein